LVDAAHEDAAARLAVAQRGHDARVDAPAVLEEDLLVADVGRLAAEDGRGRQPDDAAGALVDGDGDAVGVEDDHALLDRGDDGAGADIVRVAVPRDRDGEALKTIVRESSIPVIADIHFNRTLALKALDAGAHCVRINPGNIGGPDKVGQVVERARELGTPLRVGVNSGSLPEHLRQLEYDDPVEALVSAATEMVELMERLEFANFKVSMKSTSVPNTIASNRRLAERIPYPLHLGVTEAGTKWSG